MPLTPVGPLPGITPLLGLSIQQIMDLLTGTMTDQAVVIGSATGGSKGSGTVNATGLYINGAGVLAFQNSSDNSRKLQMLTSSEITTDTAFGSLWFGSAALLWPSSFATTPRVVFGATGASGLAWPATISSVTSSGLTVTVAGGSSTSAATVELWGLG